MADCFSNIIGLTPKDSSYFTETLDADNGKSTSGLYVDGLEETSLILKVLNGVTDAEKNINSYFKDALAASVAAFKEYLFMELGTRYTVKQAPFVGLIGQNTFTTARSTTANFIGAAYEMMPLKGGVLTVKKVYVSLNQTVPVQVKIYKAYVMHSEYQLQGDPIKTIDVSAVANTSVGVTLDEPLLLPLTDNDTTHILHYLFLIDRTAGFQPMDNKAACGCSSQMLVDRWLIQGGIEGADQNHLQLSSRRTGATGYINGIVTDATVQCSDTSFMCDGYFASPYVKVAMEHAIRYETAARLLSTVLRRDEVNRFALTKREQMATDSAILHGKFKKNTAWVAENIDMKPNNCFVCNTLNDFNGPYKTGIRF